MIRKLMSGNHTILLRNSEQLATFATCISPFVAAGDFIALTGSLGAGKTTLTQQLCFLLGVTEKVTSPTFTLLNEYTATSLRILHGDLYRLDTEEIPAVWQEIEARLCEPETCLLLEWADKAPTFADDWSWHIHLAENSAAPPTSRLLTFSMRDVSRFNTVRETLANVL